MKYPRYPVTASDNRQVFEFYSDGPRGVIKKTVIYTYIGHNLFNLAFGDWDKGKQGIDDSNRSNNADREQVLATVAYTARDFFEVFPDAKLIMEGSTPARTRLYQMGINHNYVEISSEFEIKGLLYEEWELFKIGRNYEAFLISKKNSKFGCGFEEKT